ncbi:MAG: FAD-dependent oxidoreductase [Candidatus Njordarchaeia archaeon]
MRAIVIGAGPAGLNAAIFGAKKGFKIELFEKDGRDEIPTKPCGEAIPKYTFKYLPRDLDRDFIINHIKKAYIYYNGELLRVFNNPDLIEGYIISKKKFLKELVEIAESEGVKINWRKSVKPSDLVNKFGEYKYVVDATGKGFIARNFLSYKKYRVMPVLQAYAKGEGVPEDTIVVWAIERGYVWVFPRGDIFNVGVGGLYNDFKYLFSKLKEVLKKFNLKLITKISGAALSYSGPLERFTYRNLRVIGEAAGFVMPITGEGIRFAVASGKYVFDENYEEEIYDEFVWKLKNGYRALKWLLRIKDKARLGKLAGDETYLSFFNGTVNVDKLAKSFLFGLVSGLKRKH